MHLHALFFHRVQQCFLLSNEREHLSQTPQDLLESPTVNVQKEDVPY